MKVVIVNCFDTYEDRVLLLKEYFEKRGNAVRVITSDYRHFKKEYRTEKPKGFIFVHARSYTKNLSADRPVSSLSSLAAVSSSVSPNSIAPPGIPQVFVSERRFNNILLSFRTTTVAPTDSIGALPIYFLISLI